MGSMSNYLENKILDHIVGKTAYTIPAVYVALCSSDPADSATGAACNEVSNSAGYARYVTAGSDWDTAASGATDNAVALTFSAATGAWGTVTHFCLVDSGTYGAGNVLCHASVSTSKVVGNGDVVQFAISALDITLA